MFNARMTAVPNSDVPRHQLKAYLFLAATAVAAVACVGSAVLAVRAGRRKRQLTETARE
jgi:hypothetical protein